MSESKTTKREEELNRFLELMEQFVHYIADDILRECMEDTLRRMRLVNAE